METNTVISALQKIKKDFINHTDQEFICHCAARFKGPELVKIVHSHKPNSVLFPELTIHPNWKGWVAWWTYSGDLPDEVREQKIKYLGLLIAKLKSGFNIGDVVQKKSGKPFKCGDKIASIIGFTINKFHPAKTLGAILSDQSVVSLSTLKIVDNTTQIA